MARSARERVVTLMLATLLAPATAAPLTDTPGDPARGRAIVANRQVGLCLLCHSAPITGRALSRRSCTQSRRRRAAAAAPTSCRERLINSSKLNPNSIMPSYYRDRRSLTRCAPAHAGKTIFTAQQIDGRRCLPDDIEMNRRQALATLACRRRPPVRPAQSDAQSSDLATALRTYTGGATTKESRVKLDIAELVDNGNAVPVTVTVDSPMTAANHVTAIALFNEKNPQRDIARFQLGPRSGKAIVVHAHSSRHHAAVGGGGENERRFVLDAQRRCDRHAGRVH